MLGGPKKITPPNQARTTTPGGPMRSSKQPLNPILLFLEKTGMIPKNSTSRLMSWTAKMKETLTWIFESRQRYGRLCRNNTTDRPRSLSNGHFRREWNVFWQTNSTQRYFAFRGQL